MKFDRIRYANLNARQKETYNFQKVAALLADYGFNCIKLTDDWQGADFLAYHKDGRDTLRVQLKARVHIDKKYCEKGLFMAFPIDGDWYLIAHDDLVKLVGETTNWLETASWKSGGRYTASKPSKRLVSVIEGARLGPNQSLQPTPLTRRG